MEKVLDSLFNQIYFLFLKPIANRCFSKDVSAFVLFSLNEVAVFVIGIPGTHKIVFFFSIVPKIIKVYPKF